MNDLELKKKAEEKRKKEELEEAKKIAEQLNDKVVKVSVKAGENGKVFGSVTNKEIADALAKQTGMDIDKKKIVLKETIKNIGRFSVDVKFGEGINAKLTLNIMPE